MQVTDPYVQEASGIMAYPDRGSLNRLLFKAPLVAWRMGMGRLLGSYMLVLTTWGRKSHLPRHAMVAYTPLKDCIYLGAAWGNRSDWYQNLIADGHVILQVWDEQVTGVSGEMVLPAKARRITEEDEFRLVSQRLMETGGDAYFKPWLGSLGIEYNIEDMLAKRDRLHLVGLDLQPVAPKSQLLKDGYPPPMEIDLQWVWAALVGSFSLGWLMGRRRR